MVVQSIKVGKPIYPKRMSLSCLDDQELLRLHRAGALAKIVNYQGPLRPQNYSATDSSPRSRLETETLVSILGDRCRPGESRLLQVPPHLEALRDRLFYLLLGELDPERNYVVDRSKTTLCFFDEQKRLVSLMPGGELEALFPPGFIRPDPKFPQVEVAALTNPGEINVLDAGIGRSTTIYALLGRLSELGRRPTGYGINLTAEPLPVNHSITIFTGIFEDFPFPVKFDLVYSQLGSSYYTPNIPKYIQKLKSTLRPGGVALLNIVNFRCWQPVLRDENMPYLPLYHIHNTIWTDHALQHPEYDKTPPEILDKFRQPFGLLIQYP